MAVLYEAPDVTVRRSIAKTYHRTIGMAPTSVDASNQETVWQRIYGGDAGRSKPKLRVDDRVRISKAKKRFRKGYTASWSEELFAVGETHPFDPPVYRLIDDAGTKLDGTFYEQELQKVIVSQGKRYGVEAVLQRRKKGKRAEVLVKWSGYPASFNTWIDAKAVVAYKG